MALQGVEDLRDGDFEESGIGLSFAFVSCGRGGIAQDERLGWVRAVAGRIGGAEDGDGFCAEGYGEMEGTGVSADDALRALEKGHELAEFAVVEEGIGVAAGGFYRGGESFFAGAVVDYAARVQFGANFLAEFAEAFGGPAFGAPAAAGAQDDVIADASCGEVGANALTVGFAYLQIYRADGGLRAGS
jgi:hypothetical protein